MELLLSLKLMTAQPVIVIHTQEKMEIQKPKPGERGSGRKE